MLDRNSICQLADRFVRQSEFNLKIAILKQKYTVWWMNPDIQNKWDIYQSGLSKTKADSLAHKIEFIMSPRWFDHNVPTRVLLDGALPS